MGLQSGTWGPTMDSWALSREHGHPLPVTLTAVAGSTGPPLLLQGLCRLTHLRLYQSNLYQWFRPNLSVLYETIFSGHVITWFLRQLSLVSTIATCSSLGMTLAVSHHKALEVQRIQEGCQVSVADFHSLQIIERITTDIVAEACP